MWHTINKFRQVDEKFYRSDFTLVELLVVIQGVTTPATQYLPALWQ